MSGEGDREQIARTAFIAYGLNGRDPDDVMIGTLDYAAMWDQNPHAAWRSRWLHVAEAIARGTDHAG